MVEQHRNTALVQVFHMPMTIVLMVDKHIMLIIYPTIIHIIVLAQDMLVVIMAAQQQKPYHSMFMAVEVLVEVNITILVLVVEIMLPTLTLRCMNQLHINPIQIYHKKLF